MVDAQERSELLNVAEVVSVSQVLGPGRRFVIYLQGCRKRCAGCGSPEWQDEEVEARLIRPGDLARTILAVPDLEGITISGGEPFLQASQLVALVDQMHTEKALTVICYTGHMLEDLVSDPNPAVGSLLWRTDVLIDGAYEQELDTGRGLRGSSNQRFHFLSGQYAELRGEFETCERRLEVHKNVIAGVKPQGCDSIITHLLSAG